MKKGLLLTVFLIISLAVFSQNRPSLSLTEKEELEGYEFIENKSNLSKIVYIMI